MVHAISTGGYQRQRERERGREGDREREYLRNVIYTFSIQIT